MSIYGITYHKLPQMGYFRSKEPLKRGEQVVVLLEQGETLARVCSGPYEEAEIPNAEGLPLVARKAEAHDLATNSVNQEYAALAKKYWIECVQELELTVKLVDVEIFLDRSKYIFYFTSSVRIDFRALVKKLVHEYRVRIELRQIGVRHEIQLIGALGNCGMVCCCKRYLSDFEPVTIRMAKEQNLFLNPTKVSGVCGRLLCCLAYEQESYDSFHRESPRLLKRYQTKKGLFRVLRSNMFCNSIVCAGENGEEYRFSLEEWKELAPKRYDVSGENVAGTKSGEQPERESGSGKNMFDDFYQGKEEGETALTALSDPPAEQQGKRRRRRGYAGGSGSSRDGGSGSSGSGASDLAFREEENVPAGTAASKPAQGQSPAGSREERGRQKAGFSKPFYASKSKDASEGWGASGAPKGQKRGGRQSRQAPLSSQGDVEDSRRGSGKRSEAEGRSRHGQRRSNQSRGRGK